MDYLHPRNKCLRLALKAVDLGSFPEASTKNKYKDGSASSSKQWLKYGVNKLSVKRSTQFLSFKKGGHDVSFEFWTRAYALANPSLVLKNKANKKNRSETGRIGGAVPSSVASSEIPLQTSPKDSDEHDASKNTRPQPHPPSPVEVAEKQPPKKKKKKKVGDRWMREFRERKKALEQWDSGSKTRDAIVQAALEVLDTDANTRRLNPTRRRQI